MSGPNLSGFEEMIARYTSQVGGTNEGRGSVVAEDCDDALVRSLDVESSHRVRTRATGAAGVIAALHVTVLHTVLFLESRIVLGRCTNDNAS